MNIKKSSFLCLYTIFIIVLIIISLELLLKFYFKNQKIPTDNKNYFQYIFYSEGKLFKPGKNYFKYQPNLNKRITTFYYQNNKFIKIYDYNFKTNNFGLVQSTNINPKKKSIIFLGDSFTEGIGAPPWIDKFKGDYLGYQVLNGGFQGTGFAQFKNVFEHLGKDFTLEKVVVLYIGGDLRRNILIPSNSKCLLDHSFCDRAFGVYSIPKIESEINNFLKKKYNQRLDTKKSFKEKMRFFLRDKYIYNILRSQVSSIRLKNNKTIEMNLQSIEDLFEQKKSKIIFINLKTAEEIILKKDSYETQLLKKFFIKKKIPNYSCDMNYDISNFHLIDFHPNEKGYNEIYLCVKKILSNNF